MKTYYIVNGGACEIGTFATLAEAQKAAFRKMGDCDHLTDAYKLVEKHEGPLNTSYCIVDTDRATVNIIMRETDEEIDDVPSGLWFWADPDDADKPLGGVYYDSFGTVETL